MHSVEKIAPPPLGLCLPFVLFVVLQELLLLIRIGLEEEATYLVKGAAQAMEEFAHTAPAKPSTEGFLDPVAHLCRGLEAAGGDLSLERVELARPESARVAVVLQGEEGLQSAAVVELQPVADGAGADAEEFRDLFERPALAQPQQGRETIVEAHVILLAPQFVNLHPQQSIQSEVDGSVRHGDFSSASCFLVWISCYSEEKPEGWQYIWKTMSKLAGDPRRHAATDPCAPRGRACGSSHRSRSSPRRKE